MKSTYTLPLLLLLGWLSANPGPSERKITKLLPTPQNKDIKGLQLMAQHCFTCHNPDYTGGHEGRLGPPMGMVRKHYYREGTSQKEFEASIIAFVSDPKEEKVRMKGAVKNFGLMPKLYISTKDISIIANYLFQNDLSSEDWKKNWEEFKKKN